LMDEILVGNVQMMDQNEQEISKC